ncbi:MAG: hypothetical protein REI64_15040 [Pedobacter sp.]|uniref:hypothetical protein n=1 Tax=Pedobacter sp. TaxID=1411316 RepID=UPI00280A1A90|nr:hypothetical protein [Pedobacter sp.]MDQ8006115.1 hypothetical protein [Pedobacter sp.]
MKKRKKLLLFKGMSEGMAQNYLKTCKAVLLKSTNKKSSHKMAAFQFFIPLKLD